MVVNKSVWLPRLDATIPVDPLARAGMMTDQIAGYMSLARNIDGDVSRSALQHFYVRPSFEETRLTWDDLSGAWRQWVRDVAAGRTTGRLNFYLHVPFCSHRCNYCIYYSVAPPDSVGVAAWAERMRVEIPYWGELLGGTPLWSVYVGGGTPTVIEPRVMRELLGLVRQNFVLRPGGERTFECNPLTASLEKAVVFADAGFNRASFGVQTINPAALTAVNRGYQTVRRIDETFRILHECRFSINVDLIQGLPGESTGAIRDSLAYVMSRGPAEITLHNLAPSTPESVLAKASSGPLSRTAEDVAKMVDDAGYEVSVYETSLKFIRKASQSKPTLLSDEALAVGEMVCYDDVSQEPASLMAIGPTTRSQVFANLRYMFDRYQPDAAFNPVGECAVGRALTRREAQGQYVVRCLARNIGVDPEAFRRLFAESLQEVFGDAPADAMAASLIRSEGGRLFHACDGAVERFATEMLFVEPEKIADMFENPGRASKSSTSPESVFVVAGPVRLLVVLADCDDGVRLAHVKDKFGFFVHSSSEGYECSAGAAVVRLFIRLFDSVVEKDLPGSVAQLRAALLSRGRYLPVSAPEKSALHGAVMRIESGGRGS